HPPCNEPSGQFISFDKMYCHEMRHQTFADWPFREDSNCTPEKMVKAGFVHSPSENAPDVACCFFCLIELEGWEPDDDPWSEHAKRSPTCGFLTMKKDFTELTVAEYYNLEKDRLKVYIVSVHAVCTHSELCHTAIPITLKFFLRSRDSSMAAKRDEVELSL
uniref:Baculoviral IAP repeat-containing protein 5.1-like n=1 Tax=Sphaeramia orbicularis TaxID=375764 RepID=A0A672Y8U3_9TELE